jgi:ABC-type uncharacterized transport system substrate-binding protein
MRRRAVITLLGSAAARPFAARAQQSSMLVVGFVNTGPAGGLATRATAFRKGLSETGYVEGQNVTVEYHWLEGRYDRLPEVVADLVRRQVAVIATPGSVVAALAAKAATATIPIVFGVPEDPVGLGLVANIARPGGNATGINSFSQEVIGKRLQLLHDLVPKAVRLAVLLNPSNASSAQITLQEVQKVAPVIGLQAQILNATTIGEIDAALYHTCARAPRCPLRRSRRILQQPRRTICHFVGARKNSGCLFGAGSSGSWRSDGLRSRPRGHVSSSRRLCRQHPQGREARRLTLPWKQFVA